MPKLKNPQTVSEQEKAAIEDYLARRFAGKVDHSVRFVVSGPMRWFKKPVAKKNGDIFLLQEGAVYCHTKLEHQAKPLEPLIEGSGLFIASVDIDGDVVYLKLLRITDYAQHHAA